MEIRRYAALIRRYWSMLLAAVLVALAAGAGFYLLRAPEYIASTRVFVAVKSSADASQLSQGGAYAQDIVSSYASVASTPLILAPVIKGLGLDVSADDLAKRVTASSTAGTVIIQIAATDRSPRTAASIADAVASQLASSVSVLSPTTGASGSSVQITQLENADVPIHSSGPAASVVGALSLAFGLLVGLALIAAREVLDTRLRNVDDMSVLIGAPFLGFTRRDATRGDGGLAAARAPGDPEAEQYRSLRTNLQFIGIAQRSRAWVVTSSLAGEGKTVAVANLAVALSELKMRVLVIDADLRRPSLDRQFGIENAVGLTDVLIGRCTLDEAIQQWGTDDLAVLPAGALPPNPNELLQSREASDLLVLMRERYDVLLFDAPPLLPVSDAAVLARLTDGAMLLAAFGRVRRQQLKASEQVLLRAGAKLLGTVVTRVPLRDAAIYGTGYGYGTSVRERPARGIDRAALGTE